MGPVIVHVCMYVVVVLSCLLYVDLGSSSAFLSAVC